ncbi:hypothetical protein KKH26_02865 [Patescibacteria group bacterium]|nr:hypothetical protein [Patescibacteria group bacterium]
MKKTGFMVLLVGLTMLNNDIPLFGAEDSLPKFVSFAQKKMPLGLGEENHNSPIWLGDGKTIAFGIRWLSKSSGTEDAIYLINVDGTNLREFLIPKAIVFPSPNRIGEL